MVAISLQRALKILAPFFVCAVLTFALGKSLTTSQAQAQNKPGAPLAAASAADSVEGRLAALDLSPADQAPGLGAAPQPDPENLKQTLAAAQKSYNTWQNTLSGQAAQNTAEGYLRQASSLEPQQPWRQAALAVAPQQTVSADIPQPAGALPAAVEAAMNFTLQPLHLNRWQGGLSSGFVITNTNLNAVDVTLSYFWANHTPAFTSMHVIASAGRLVVYLPNIPELGNNFYGYVQVTSSMPVSGQIVTQRYAALGGRVYQPDGVTPYNNAGVTAFKQPNNQAKYDTGTLSDGSFYIGGLPSGVYILRINVDRPYAAEFYNQAVTQPDSFIFDLGQPAQITTTKVVLLPGGQISGTVYADDGITPLANVNVDLAQGWYGDCTDAQGHYTLHGVPYGGNRVRAGGGWNWCTNSNSPYIEQFYNRVPNFDQATPVLVDSAHEVVSGIDFRLQTGGEIRGRVTNAATGQGVETNLSAWNNNAKGWAHADANGYYTMTGLLPGDYYFSVDPNTLPAGLGQIFYPAALSEESAIRLHVTQGAVVEGINLALPPGGTMSGRLLNAADGSPIANATVDIKFVNLNGGKGVCTDQAGYFLYKGLPYETYTVSAGGNWDWCANRSSPYTTQYFDHAADYGQAAHLTIGPGSTDLTNLNFDLSLGSTIQGKVTDAATGLPVANVYVMALDPNTDKGMNGANTDQNGNYAISGLSPGGYHVRADAYSLPAGFGQIYYPNQISWQDAGLITLGASQVITGINLALPPGGSISGHIYDKQTGLPVPNMNLSAGNVNLPFGIGTCTDANGYYSLHGLPYSSYTVNTDSNWNWCTNSPAVYPFTVYSDTYSWSDAVQFHLQAGSDTFTAIDFHLQKGSFIQGVVKDDAGSPVAGLRMEAGAPNNQCNGCWDGYGGTQTDLNGIYTLGPLPPTGVFVQACPACSGQLFYNQYYSGSLTMDTAQLLNLAPGQTLSEINFTMHTGVILTGTVSVPGGYSPGGIQMDIWPNGNFNYYAGTRTDNLGNYQVALPPILDVMWTVAARPYGTDLGAQWANNFDLSREHHWDFDLKLGGAIQGCISDGSQPVTNVFVNAWSPQGGMGTQVDQNGCYLIGNLPPGGYSVRAEGWPGHVPTTYGSPSGILWSPLELRAGEIQTAHLTMPPAGQIVGRVTSKANGAAVEKVRLVAFNAQGVWETYSQSDGSYLLDAPAGDYKLLAIPPDWQFFNGVYYPSSLNYAQAVTITLPARTVAAFTADLALDARGSLSGIVLDADTGLPLAGVHVVARGLSYPDKQTNAWWNGCTDDTGAYSLTGVDPGLVEIEAFGQCSKFAYNPYTHTLTMAQGGSQAFNIVLKQNGLRLAEPFQVLVEETFDHSPAGLIWSGLDAPTSEDVMAALFTPLAYADDTGAWQSELLTAVPTFENNLAAIHQESLVVTYTLKTGLSWSDGAPLTSADIAFTWRKLTQPSPYTNYDSAKPIFHIQSVSTPTPQTAVVTFQPRYDTSNYLLALTYLLPDHILHNTHIMDIVFGSTYANMPVGNGAYLPTRYVPGGYLDVRANPNFAGASRGLPNIKNARFTFMGDPFRDLVNRQVDAAANVQNTKDLPPDYASHPLQIVQSENGGVEFMYLNTERPQLSETQVRQALWLALDRQGAISQLPPGTSTPGASYLAKSSPFYNPANPLAPFNLTQAASLLTTAGWTDHNSDGIRDKNGLALSFSLAYNSGNAFRRNLALKYQSDLATIGVQLQLRAFPSLGPILEDFKRGYLDAACVGWMGYLRYDTEFARELASRSIPTAYNSYSGNNFSRYSSPANDLLLQAVFQPQGFTALKQAYLDHQALFGAQLPMLPTQHYTRLDGARPDLVNFKPFGLAPLTWNMAEWLLPENPYDLAVFIGLAPGSPLPTAGGLITYELNVLNSGYLTVTQASLVDYLPVNAAFVRAIPAPDSASPADSKYWNLGSLGPGQHAKTLLVVRLADGLSQGEVVATSAQVSSHEPESRPGNNGFSFSLVARTKADLAITLGGSGQTSVGEKFEYFADYTNLGGTTVSGAVVTMTLPAQMTYLLAEPAPASMDGRTLTWNLPPLQPMQWGGRILVRTRIDSAGAANALAQIGSTTAESSFANNTGSHAAQVTGILAPVITRPTLGVTDRTPTFAGLAPAGALVKLYNITGAVPQLLGSVTAAISGTFRLELNLNPGTYIVVAVAEKSGLTSANSNSATISVQNNLALDPDYVTITDAGVDVSNGAVRTQRRLRSFSLVHFDLRLPCASQPTAYLDVTENGLYQVKLPPVVMESLPGGQWHTGFDLWIANVRSSYNVFVVWDCGNGEQRELLVYILIDPDGYVFDQTLVTAGASMTNSLLTSAVITAYVKTGSDWAVWPAALYGQTNPQQSNSQSDDGVPTPGYYSFLTPSGQYRIKASAPGYQPYESPVLTVITTPVHLDIGMLPIQVSVQSLFKPADLSASVLQTNQPWGRMGDYLTYTLQLANSGDVAASLVLTDVLPAGVKLEGIVYATSSQVSYNPAARAITWKPVIDPGATATLTFHVRLLPVSPNTVILHNEFSVSGPQEVLLTLPSLVSDVPIDPGIQVYLPFMRR